MDIDENPFADEEELIDEELAKDYMPEETSENFQNLVKQPDFEKEPKVPENG